MCAHRGTYTSQAGIKRNNRKSEIALREMEFLGSLAAATGFSFEMEKADRLWKILLFHQFHDILPGSSIERVYEDASAAHGTLQQEALQMADEAAGYLLKQDGGVSFFNSLSFQRTALVTLPEEYENGAVTMEGCQVPIQKGADGKIRALLFLPSCGAVSLYPLETWCMGEREVKACGEMPGALIWQDAAGYHMENEHIAALVDLQGQVTSFILKSTNREIAAEPMNQLRLYKDQPRAFDAWDIDSNYRSETPKMGNVREIAILRQGLEAVLQIKGVIGKSEYIQHICLQAGQKRLEFQTQVEWRELHQLLKTSFPVAVHSANARHEMQFGYVERPTHRSRAYDRDRFEVCNHRYTALCDESHGAALLNDCKYGISVNGNDMELTLLRASASPQMQADNGTQQFAYALYAWEGSFVDSDAVQQGYEFNIKPYLARGGMPAFEAVQIDKKNIILETMKMAEDGSGDIILRLYEAAGAAIQTTVRINLPAEKIWECDMLEHKKEGGWESELGESLHKLSFRAFEIKTLRLYR